MSRLALIVAWLKLELELVRGQDPLNGVQGLKPPSEASTHVRNIASQKLLCSSFVRVPLPLSPLDLGT